MRPDLAITIAPMQPGDVRAFHALVIDTLAEFGMHEDADLDRDLADPLAAYDAAWVARHDGTLVGSVALRRAGDDAFSLQRMYVRPDCRGAGLGARLLTTALDHARTAGARAVHLHTAAAMAAAQRLYERAGFRRTGTRSEAGEHDSRCEVLYTLDL
jgi:ribosomal protein S18 acetylase RimI-like enzyme